MENIENKYIMYVNAYLGIEKLDEYDLKIYLLNELKEYIADFKKENNISLDFDTCYNFLEKKDNYISSLQDALYVLNELNGPIELIHIISAKLKE